MNISQVGKGQVTQTDNRTMLTNHPTPEQEYSNAQLSDYDLPDPQFTLCPTPTQAVELSLTAYTATPAEQLRGTAGFGFWNHPFSPDAGLKFRLPQALWFFFASPPNHMKLARHVAGHGWKAATINTRRWQFLSLLPAAPLGFLLMRVPLLYRRLWGIGQAAIGVRETALPLHMLNEPHQYRLRWSWDSVIWMVDETVILHTTHAIPRDALGLVIWLDNQYAIVTPQGNFGWGTIPIRQTQSLVIEEIQLSAPTR